MLPEVAVGRLQPVAVVIMRKSGIMVAPVETEQAGQPAARAASSRTKSARAGSSRINWTPCQQVAALARPRS